MAPENPALRHRLHKKASLSITCFSVHHFQDFESLHSSSIPSSPNYRTSSPRGSRAKRMKPRLHRHRRHTSELSYDADSYAHNFEDARNVVGMDTEEIPGFVSRLPASPQPERRDEVDVTPEQVVHLPVEVAQQSMEV